MQNRIKIIIATAVFTCSILSCKTNQDSKETSKETVKVPSLKDLYKEDFNIGTAISRYQITGNQPKAINLLANEFNAITAENDMKWEKIHPAKDSFNFNISDKYVGLGEKHNMHIVGHTLVWHSQLAPWVKEVKDSSALFSEMKNHINTIVNRYKGKINSWDVVNEALNEDGTLRETHFLNVLGEDYIAQAFQLAAEADPKAQLIYNDFNLTNPKKRDGVVRLVKRLQEKGVKIDAIGMQGHWSLKGPSIEKIENSIIAFSNLGVKVLVTELDVSALPNPWELVGAGVEQNFTKYEKDSIMNPYPDPKKLPEAMKAKIAKRYEAIFKLFLKHKDKIDRITFWGVNDSQSWLNDWPIKGRTNYPLLFDRTYQKKQAYHSVMALKKITKQ